MRRLLLILLVLFAGCGPSRRPVAAVGDAAPISDDHAAAIKELANAKAELAALKDGLPKLRVTITGPDSIERGGLQRFTLSQDGGSVCKLFVLPDEHGEKPEFVELDDGKTYVFGTNIKSGEIRLLAATSSSDDMAVGFKTVKIDGQNPIPPKPIDVIPQPKPIVTSMGMDVVTIKLCDLIPANRKTTIKPLSEAFAFTAKNEAGLLSKERLLAAQKEANHTAVFGTVAVVDQDAITKDVQPFFVALKVETDKREAGPAADVSGYLRMLKEIADGLATVAARGPPVVPITGNLSLIIIEGTTRQADSIPTRKTWINTQRAAGIDVLIFGCNSPDGKKYLAQAGGLQPPILMAFKGDTRAAAIVLPKTTGEIDTLIGGWK